MADNEDKFKIDLDAKDAVKSVLELKEHILSLSESKNLEGLISGFMNLAVPIAAAGAVLYAFKTAMDMTLEGEEIIRIEKNFEALSEQVGVSSTKMKEDLGKVLDGTVDMTDAMKSANKAMIELGPNSEKIPQIFELARKAARNFGGDATEVFEGMTQAIASGNTRMLKQYGIILDNNKVLQDYAKTVGTTVGSLTQQEQQTARLQAVLEKGKDAYMGIGLDADNVTTNIKKLHLAWKDFTEQLDVFIAKSPIVQDFLKGLKVMVGTVSDTIKENFGTSAEKAELKVKALTERLVDLEQKSFALKNQSGVSGFLEKFYKFGQDPAMLQKSIDDVKSQIAGANQELAKFQKENAEKIDKETSSAAGNKKDITHTQDPAEIAKFNAEIASLSKKRVQEEMETETNFTAFLVLQEQERTAIENETQAKIEEIEEKARKGKELTAEQATELIVNLKAEETAKLAILAQKQRADFVKPYENALKAARTTSEGIKAGFAEGGAKAISSLNNFGAVGQQVFGVVAKNAKSFFIALGDGSKSAGDAMKGFLFNSLADIAEAQGQLLLEAGIGMVNPVQIAEGGALLALSGLLRSQAGGAGGSSMGGGGGGASAPGGAGSSIGGGTATAAPLTPTTQSGKNVTIQFSGSYFDTDQTRTRLVDLMRQETDATGYKYEQIGVS